MVTLPQSPALLLPAANAQAPAAAFQVANACSYGDALLQVVTLPEKAVLLVGVAGAQAPAVRRGADGNLEGEPFGLQVWCQRILLVLTGASISRAFAVRA